MSKEGKDWVQLVRDARKNDQGFKELAKALEPTLTGLAVKIASQMCEDAKQAALLKVWENLDRVDLRKKKTIKTMLFGAAISGMRTEVRKHLKFINSRAIISEKLIEELSSKKDRHSGYEFKGLLGHYCDYIRRTGSMRGAHAFFAKIHHVTVDTMKRRFHNEALKFLETEGLGNIRISEEDIVEKLLEG